MAIYKKPQIKKNLKLKSLQPGVTEEQKRKYQNKKDAESKMRTYQNSLLKNNSGSAYKPKTEPSPEIAAQTSAYSVQTDKKVYNGSNVQKPAAIPDKTKETKKQNTSYVSAQPKKGTVSFPENGYYRPDQHNKKDMRYGDSAAEVRQKNSVKPPKSPAVSGAEEKQTLKQPTFTSWQPNATEEQKRKYRDKKDAENKQKSYLSSPPLLSIGEKEKNISLPKETKPEFTPWQPNATEEQKNAYKEKKDKPEFTQWKPGASLGDIEDYVYNNPKKALSESALDTYIVNSVINIEHGIKRNDPADVVGETARKRLAAKGNIINQIAKEYGLEDELRYLNATNKTTSEKLESLIKKVGEKTGILNTQETETQKNDDHKIERNVQPNANKDQIEAWVYANPDKSIGKSTLEEYAKQLEIESAQGVKAKSYGWSEKSREKILDHMVDKYGLEKTREEMQAIGKNQSEILKEVSRKVSLQTCIKRVGEKFGLTPKGDGTYDMTEIVKAYAKKYGPDGMITIKAGGSGSIGMGAYVASVSLVIDFKGNIALMHSSGEGIGAPINPVGGSIDVSFGYSNDAKNIEDAKGLSATLGGSLGTGFFGGNGYYSEGYVPKSEFTSDAKAVDYLMAHPSEYEKTYTEYGGGVSFFTKDADANYVVTYTDYMNDLYGKPLKSNLFQMYSDSLIKPIEEYIYN